MVHISKNPFLFLILNLCIILASFGTLKPCFPCTTIEYCLHQFRHHSAQQPIIISDSFELQEFEFPALSFSQRLQFQFQVAGGSTAISFKNDTQPF